MKQINCLLCNKGIYSELSKSRRMCRMIIEDKKDFVQKNVKFI